MERVRLHIVTGKGGTGKTTVAAALAVALADQGKRVLLAEVEGRQGISQTFDVTPLGTAEARIAHANRGGEVYGLSIDAKAALLEYLQLFYKLGRAGGALERFGAIDFATTIAPGVRDVLLIGKVYEAVRRKKDGKRRGAPVEPVYDAVVLDAPPTGRVVHFLNVNSEVAGLAKVGPIRSQADSITRLLRSRETAVHLVTLLEEMPVQETVDAAEQLRAISLHLGVVVVNQVRDPLLRPEQLAALTAGLVDVEKVRAELTSVGLTSPASLAQSLVDEGGDHAQRVELEEQEGAVVEALGLPTYRLPVFPDGIDAGTVRELALTLADQGLV